MRTYEMRFLWPDEIDFDRTGIDYWWACYDGNQESLEEDEIASAFMSGYVLYDMPPRAPLVPLTVQDQVGAEEMAESIFKACRPSGSCGYAIFHHTHKGQRVHQVDRRPKILYRGSRRDPDPANENRPGLTGVGDGIGL